jgi:biopolymer transport protein ExbD
MHIGQKNKLFFFVLLAVFFATGSLCFAATLRWDPPSQGTVTGYRVKYGTSSTTPSTTVTVGNTNQYYLDNAPLAENRTYYFWVTAYNATGESPPAGPVSFNTSDSTPPAPPTGVTAN